MGFSLAGFLVAGVALLWTYHLPLSRLVATRLLDRSGLGPVGMTVSRMDLFGLRAHDINLYGGAIRVADLSLAYGNKNSHLFSMCPTSKAGAEAVFCRYRKDEASSPKVEQDGQVRSIVRATRSIKVRSH